VTGTAVSGEVRSGDKVRHLPGDETLRVRSVEVHNQAVDVGVRGQRVALNLSGTVRAPIERGDVIVNEAITLISDRFDARIEVRSSASASIKDHQRVRVHLGTAERLGKVLLLQQPDQSGDHVLAPGGAAMCQVTVAQPLSAMKGDRFILRDETGQRTIAGGTVVLASAGKHKRSDPGLLARLRAIETGGPASALIQALTREHGGFVISVASLSQFINRAEEVVRARFEAAPGVHVFKVDGAVEYAADDDCRQVKSSLLDAVTQWHAAHPLAAGVDVEEARTGLPHAVPAKIFRVLVQELERDKLLARDGNLLRLPHYRVTIPDASADLAERIGELLGQSPLTPPDLKQLGDLLGVDRRRLIELMRAMERQRSVVCVAPDLYFLRSYIDRVRSELVSHLSAQPGITTGEFRDRYQTSRKYAIPLLEHFDREGVTIRVGEVRRLKQAPTEIA
jgi:selenocysteine-specific elongation factor